MQFLNLYYDNVLRRWCYILGSKRHQQFICQIVLLFNFDIHSYFLDWPFLACTLVLWEQILDVIKLSRSWKFEISLCILLVIFADTDWPYIFFESSKAGARILSYSLILIHVASECEFVSSYLSGRPRNVDLICCLFPFPFLQQLDVSFKLYLLHFLNVRNNSSVVNQQKILDFSWA